MLRTGEPRAARTRPGEVRNGLGKGGETRAHAGSPHGPLTRSHIGKRRAEVNDDEAAAPARGARRNRCLWALRPSSIFPRPRKVPDPHAPTPGRPRRRLLRFAVCCRRCAGLGADAVATRIAADAAAAPQDPLLARVDGQEVRMSDVAAVASEVLPPELRALPPGALLQMLPPEVSRQLVDRAITERALVAAARAAGLDRDDEVRRRIRRAEEQELQQALLTREVGGKVTDDAIRARYDQEAAKPAGRAGGPRPPHPGADRSRRRAKPWPSWRAAPTSPRSPAAAPPTPARSRAAATSASSSAATWCPEFAEAAFALQPGQVERRAGAEPVRLARHQGGGAARRRRALLRGRASRSSSGGCWRKAWRPWCSACRSAAKIERLDLGGAGAGRDLARQRRAAPRGLARRSRPGSASSAARKGRPPPWPPSTAHPASPLAVPLPELPPVAGRAARHGARRASATRRGRT